MVDLDDNLVAGMSLRQPEAVARCRKIAEALAFFEQHGEWREFTAAGPVGIVRAPAALPAFATEKQLCEPPVNSLCTWDPTLGGCSDLLRSCERRYPKSLWNG